MQRAAALLVLGYFKTPYTSEELVNDSLYKQVKK